MCINRSYTYIINYIEHVDAFINDTQGSIHCSHQVYGFTYQHRIENMMCICYELVVLYQTKVSTTVFIENSKAIFIVCTKCSGQHRGRVAILKLAGWNIMKSACYFWMHVFMYCINLRQCYGAWAR